jgi:polyhydroxyalkanoate synthesis regulator phasin
MATKAQRDDRIRWCLLRLIDGRPTHRLVSDLADREGISRRQARRVVGDAYQELQKDLDDAGISGEQYLSRMIANTETAIESALKAGHAAAAVGGVNTLARLLGIGAEQHHKHQKPWA